MRRFLTLVRGSLLVAVLSGGVDGAAAVSRGSLGRFGLDAAVGWNSDYGLFGGGARAFPTENWDVHATAGVDITGTVAGAGTAVYFDSSRTTCWFVFSCRTKWLVRATALQSQPGHVSVTDNTVTGKYALGEGYSGSLALGSYAIYGWGFIMGSEIGYRAWWQRRKVTLDSGTFDQATVDRLQKFSRDAIEVAITLGWRF